MKKLLVVIVSVFLVMAMVVGCVPKEETPPTDQNPPATETPSGNEEPGTTTLPAGSEGGQGNLNDGTYDAEGDPDERGWKGYISVTVAGGEITEVDYDEIDKDGKKKSEDDEYAKNMKNASGVAPEEAFKQLEDSLLETQNVEEVEMVSGATDSSNRFKELANEALVTTP